MEAWEHNLALESEASSGLPGNNLVLEGDSSPGVGPNLVIGVPPKPPFYHRRHYPQAHFPISLVEGGFTRRKRVSRTISWTKVFRQHYRVADDSLDRWELYLEEGQLPDFTASDQPVATSTTLPFSHTPDLPESADTKDLWAVVRKRSRFDLLSFNLHPTIITIDSGGEEVMGGMTNPEILRVLDGESGQIIVFARYPYGVDRNEADTWELYAKIGGDPDPDTDPILDTDSFGAPAADYLWRGIADGLTPGSTYHVMVVVRRSVESGDGEIGQSTVVQHTLAETYDLDEGSTWLFGGQDHEVGT